ncbi:MAG: hypothetical protein ACYCSF_13865, partial [Acidimicrobiales bacterium]
RAGQLGLDGPRIVTLGVPTTFLPHAKPDDILAMIGLDGPGIASSLLKAARRYGLVGGTPGLASETSRIESGPAAYNGSRGETTSVSSSCSSATRVPVTRRP